MTKMKKKTKADRFLERLTRTDTKEFLQGQTVITIAIIILSISGLIWYPEERLPIIIIIIFAILSDTLLIKKIKRKK